MTELPYDAAGPMTQDSQNVTGLGTKTAAGAKTHGDSGSGTRGHISAFNISLDTLRGGWMGGGWMGGGWMGARLNI